MALDMRCLWHQSLSNNVGFEIRQPLSRPWCRRSFPAHHRPSWAGAGRVAKPVRDHYSWLAPRTFSSLSLAISRKKPIPWELRDEFLMFVTCRPLLFLLA